MADDILPQPDGILPGPPSKANPLQEGIAAGTPALGPRASVADTSPELNIALPAPARTCGRCGCLTTLFWREDDFLYGLIPLGARLHFRCGACSREIKIRSLGRLFPLFFFCFVFCIFFWVWTRHPFPDWYQRAIFIGLMVPPIVLISEFRVRMANPRVGSQPWVRRPIWLFVGLAAVGIGLKVATTLGPRLTTEDAAFAAMSDQERAFYDRKFSRIKVGMAEGDVIELLGRPLNPLDLLELSWHGPGHGVGRESEITVEFLQRRVTNATWVRRTGWFSGFVFYVGK